MTILEVGSVSYFTKRPGKFGTSVFTLLALSFVFIPIVNAAPKAELIAFWDDREPLSIQQVDHSAWQDVLTAYVDDQHVSGVNRFDYASVTAADALKLKNYLRYLQLLEPRQLNDEEAKAFWINLYNAILVDKIVSAYESGSMRAVNRLMNGGVDSRAWNRTEAEVVMQEISLNDIEHGILRPIWKDPRVHFALSTSTLGGASIQKTAFDGENNEGLLEKAKVEFMQHPRAVRVQGNRLILSSVFDWYAADFGSNTSEVLTYVRDNTSDATREAILGFSSPSFDYNWDLNAIDAQSPFVVSNIDDE
jgi:hypothetical protein